MPVEKRCEDNEDDSDEEEGEDGTTKFDRPVCCGEVLGLMLGTLGFFLILAGFGFWTITLPGQADFCRIETLGLAEKPKSEQDSWIGVCNNLYELVFKMLKFISSPFIACGILALVSAWLVWSGATAHDDHGTPRYWRCAAVWDFIGVCIVWVPSIFFSYVTAAVAAALVPLHAYSVALTAGYYATKAANYSEVGQDTENGKQAMQQSTKAVETFYLGYSAATQVELCLAVGSSCMMALFWVYLADIVRAIVFTSCWHPNYGHIPEGVQMCLACEECVDKVKGCSGVGNDPDEE